MNKLFELIAVIALLATPALASYLETPSQRATYIRPTLDMPPVQAYALDPSDVDPPAVKNQSRVLQVAVTEQALDFDQRWYEITGQRIDQHPLVVSVTPRGPDLFMTNDGRHVVSVHVKLKRHRAHRHRHRRR